MRLKQVVSHSITYERNLPKGGFVHTHALREVVGAKSIYNVIDGYTHGNNKPLQSADLRTKWSPYKAPQEFAMYDSSELEDLHLQVVCMRWSPEAAKIGYTAAVSSVNGL